MVTQFWSVDCIEQNRYIEWDNPNIWCSRCGDKLVAVLTKYTCQVLAICDESIQARVYR